MYVYVACVVQYLSHVVVTHCVWPISIAFTLWFLLSLCSAVHTCISYFLYFGCVTGIDMYVLSLVYTMSMTVYR